MIKQKNDTPNAHLSLKRWLLMVAISVALSSCGLFGGEESTDVATESAAVSEPEAPAAEPVDEKAEQAAQATAAALAALTPAELKDKAAQAWDQQQLYAPAGDNAFEYYLALREKLQAPDAIAESALIDLMPYTLIAAEQATNREDFAEAERLMGLLSRADPQAPGLERIAQEISQGKEAASNRAQQEADRAERERLAAEQRARDQVASAEREAEQARLRAEEEARQRVAAQAAAARQQQAQTATPDPAAAAATQAAATPVVRSGPPVPISRPQPPYPRDALRSRVEGQVEIEYTVGADGRVTNVTVLRSSPRGVFDRTVINTVREWRYEAPGQEQVLRRTIDFKM